MGRSQSQPTRAGGGLNYRSQLQRLAEQREQAIDDVNRSVGEIAELLPRAQQAGIPLVEAAAITGLSRPTLYRMLGEARERQDLRAVTTEFEAIVDTVSKDVGHRALPAELARYCGCSTDEMFERLAQIYPLLANEFAGFGPTAISQLATMLTEPEPNEFRPPEQPILRMLFLHDMPLKRVAWSTELPDTEVLGWAALGLLDVLPRVRKTAADNNLARAPS